MLPTNTPFCRFALSPLPDARVTTHLASSCAVSLYSYAASATTPLQSRTFLFSFSIVFTARSTVGLAARDEHKKSLAAPSRPGPVRPAPPTAPPLRGAPVVKVVARCGHVSTSVTARETLKVADRVMFAELARAPHRTQRAAGRVLLSRRCPRRRFLGLCAGVPYHVTRNGC